MNNILDGKMVRNIRIKELQKKVSKLDNKLTIVVISVGENEASKIYINQKEKMANKIGYNFINLHFDNISEVDLIKEIEKLNNDPSVTSEMVQLPLPNYLNKSKILNAVDYKKDIDGLTDTSKFNLFKRTPTLIPCTPKGIVTLLNYYNIDLIKHIVIVGRSDLVGYPLFNLLLSLNATITLCHSKTKNLGEITRQADILIVAVGKKGLITKNMVKDGVIIVDVGINRIDDKIYGDVDSSCYEKALMYTPVPGGAGPMTVISLMENVYEAYLLQK